MHRFLILLILLIFYTNYAFSEEVKFILHDKCINILYRPALVYFNDTNVSVFRDSRGIILRFEIKNIKDEYENLSIDTFYNLIKINKFLAKIKNPAIIEVHVSDTLSYNFNNLKKWEISAVIAGHIEKFLNFGKSLSDRKVLAVGYGEFLPVNNTSNNGGKNFNRVDIIILCNINGE